MPKSRLRAPLHGPSLTLGLLALAFVLATAGCHQRRMFRSWSGDDLVVWPHAHERCGSGEQSVVVTDFHGRQKIKVERGRCRLEIEMRGEIDFLPDDGGVEHLERGARLEIEERIRRDRWRLEVTRGEGGAPEYEWFVDRRRATFDDEAREWLQTMMPWLFRTTGIQAPERVGRLLAAAGPDGVLDEIEQIPGDYVRSLYVRELLAQAELDDAALERVIRLAGQKIGSDHELAEILTTVSARNLAAESIRRAYVEATRSIGSDYELRRTLASLLDHRELGPEVLDAMLEAAQSIGSDYELAELLVAIADQYPDAETLPPSFAEAAASIGSDYEQRKALSAAFRRPGIGRQTLDELLATARQIGSDYELAELLSDLCQIYPGEQDLPDTFFRAAATIGSDFEQRKVLAAVIDRPDLSRETVVRVLESSRSMGSDHELAELLVTLVRTYPVDEDLRPHFMRALDTIGSSHDHDRVASALLGSMSSE